MDFLIEKAQDSLLEIGLIAGSITIIILCWILKRHVMSWLKKHIIVDALRDDSRIQELLVEIRVRTNADRVSVFLFHNGERYVNGNSILRISGAYESLAAGIASHKEYSQSMLVSTVPESVGFLCAKDPFKTVFFQETVKLSACFYKAVLESQGIQAVAKYPLVKGGDIIGFACADFVQSPGPVPSDLNIIKDTAPQIDLYLNTRGSKLQRFLSKVIKLLGGK
jgi:hypothetical protein